MIKKKERHPGFIKKATLAADRRLDRSARSPATMAKIASRRLDRRARPKATRVWIHASIILRKMKSISSHRRLRTSVKFREAAKPVKSWRLGSRRRMPVASLPSEIVATILSWLPVKSLMRFRCVCKEWRSLTYNPKFIKEHHTCARALGRLALLSTGFVSPKISLYDFGDNGEVRNQAFDMRFMRFTRFGYWSGYTMSNPVNGLVGIEHCSPKADGSNYLLSNYLLNPATRELAKLPTSGNNPWGKSASLGLGFDGSAGGYKLVMLFHIEGLMDSCGCKVLDLGNQEWREVGIAPCRIPATSPVPLNGALNWISWRCPTGNNESGEMAIVAFDLKDESFRSIPVPPECRTRGGRVRVVEWGGLLCIVMLPHMYLTESLRASVADRRCLVRIWRLEDHATCRWTEAHCSELPKHACVDGHGRLSLVGIRGHEMLMVMWRGGGPGSICSYDIRTRSLRELYHYDDPRCLQFLTESLVSPRYLPGNPSLH